MKEENVLLCSKAWIWLMSWWMGKAGAEAEILELDLDVSSICSIEHAVK